METFWKKKLVVNLVSFSITLAFVLIANLEPVSAQGSSVSRMSNRDNFSTIDVGVRVDAKPFSYRDYSDGLRRSGTGNLDDYQGYMIEICRSVLAKVVQKEPFLGAQIRAVEVTAQNRLFKLDSGEIDMLCEPTSVTSRRLENYLISTPVYISAVTIASLRQEYFPKAIHCGGIVGFVKGTTAEDPGLLLAAEQNLFFGNYSPIVSEILKEIKEKNSLDDQGTGKSERNNLPSVTSLSDVEVDVTAPDCSEGFDGNPLVAFEGHEEGLDRLCGSASLDSSRQKEKILFYMADVDIISTYLASPNTNCDIELSRSPVIREHYAIFFRAPISNAKETSVAKAYALYSEFTRELRIQLLSGTKLLERAYFAAFGNRPRTQALEGFFRSMSDVGQ